MSKSSFAAEVSATADRLRRCGFRIECCFEGSKVALTRHGRRFAFSTTASDQMLRHAKTVWSVADIVSFESALLHVVAGRAALIQELVLSDSERVRRQIRPLRSQRTKPLGLGDDSTPSDIQSARCSARCSFANRIFPFVGKATKPCPAGYKA